jgi:mannose-6-phosphate isomerase-like protein (cupin superfamily)
MTISHEVALNQLKTTSALFIELFKHGTLSIELYRPHQTDNQKPHDKDEVYAIISGSGDFYCNGNRTSFVKGDIIFVGAGEEHRFENFTNDFSTWVIFYGPRGGEKAFLQNA